MAEKLSDDAISKHLEALENWERNGDQIERKLEFEDFLAAIEFINRVAPLAEAADHHPELFNVYNRVEIVLTTHDAGGITEKDFALASRIDGVVET
jgi:4a-hydroxytetrahydrobiopterin dehydratase